MVPLFPKWIDAEVVEEDLDELGAGRRSSAMSTRTSRFARRPTSRTTASVPTSASRRLAASAVAGVIRELLPVVDNLDRAVEAAAGGTDGDAFAEGVRLVHADLHSVLDRLGPDPIDPDGRAVRPELPPGDLAGSGH